MNALNRYRQNDVVSQKPGDLLLRLLDVAGQQMALAKSAVEGRDYAQKGKAIDRALQIIGELSAVFDEEQAPETASRVRGLYGFIRERLLQGSISLDTTKLDDAASTLQTVRSIWAEAVAKARDEGYAV